MKTLLGILLGLTTLLALAGGQVRFGETLCDNPDFFCITIKAGQTWHSLFPNDEERDIIHRLNRMNIRLRAGMIIAIPKNIARLTVFDIAPFPRFIAPEGEKIIFISQQKLAWGAYSEEGELVWWGPISSGAGHCPRVIGGCLTPSGAFRIIRKQDIDCISTAFPRRADGDDGGAEMPFCMHFFRGFALHGSEEIPGFRTSHGCIRLFTQDARWLNEEFVQLPGMGLKGTRVIIDSI